MSSNKAALYSAHELTMVSNQIKESIVQAMVNEGYLTSEQGIEFASQYSVIVSEHNLLGSMVNKFLKREDSDEWHTTIVKVL